MIYFPPLRTRRLTVQLRELSIGDSLTLAAMPGHMEEASTTAFLRCAVDAAKVAVEDPARWTVQERILAVCHYLSATTEDGPDFSLGEGHYSDYLQGEADIQTSVQAVEVGEVGGDTWHVRHLTGAMAESIERMAGEIEGLSGRLHWLFGAMAAQLVRTGEEVPDAAAFAKSCANLRYHVQDAFYSEGYCQAAGTWPRGFVFIAVEKTAPYAVACYTLDDVAKEKGRELYQQDLQTLQAAQAANAWPAYSDQIETLTLPAWALR